MCHTDQQTEIGQPIACTLRQTEYTDRTAQLRTLAGAALRSREPLAGGERLVFAPGAEFESRLRDAIAAEASCCPFLRMELRAERDALVLTIVGPAEARPIIAELFA
jgi:hypothetical protein